MNKWACAHPNILLKKKEAKAKELLLSSSMRIEEVASQVGMADVGYFCRFFKKRTSWSPVKFREAYRGQSGGHDQG